MSDQVDISRALHGAIADLLEGVQLIGFDWTYLYVNATAAKHARQDAQALLGRTMQDCFPGIEQTEMFVVLQRVMRTRRPERVLNEFAYPDGSLGWFELHVEPFAEGICVLSLDVSDRRSTELQLRQAQKLESLGRLAVGIAHDFSNLLTTILGYSELLLDRDLSSEARDEVREIQKAGERASRLTRQLLGFTRKQVPVARVVNLNAIVEDSRRMLERLLGDVYVNVELDPAGDAVVADASQIEQALLNLSVNAKDAMPEGGRLVIRTARASVDALPADLDGAEEFVALSVADSGVGMAAEVLAHAVDPFFTTKPEGQGTGLGLATVNEGVRQMGGALAIQSTPDVGTTVTLFLRSGPRDPDAMGREVSSIRQSGPRSGTILVVERDSATRAFVAKVLRGCGYTVLAARGPLEALESTTDYAGPVDVVITDIVTPDVHGPHLVQRLIGRYPGVRLLYVAGGAVPPELATGQGSHVRVLFKPFTAGTLIPALQELIEDR